MIGEKFSHAGAKFGYFNYSRPFLLFCFGPVSVRGVSFFVLTSLKTSFGLYV